MQVATYYFLFQAKLSVRKHVGLRPVLRLLVHAEVYMHNDLG